MKQKVTGIGGIFFRSKDTQATKDWYSKHLGFSTDQWGTSFEWRIADIPEAKGYTQWSPMAQNTDYIPVEQDFMINYRVKDIEELVSELKANGVKVVDEIESYEYGKFVHIIDADGRKVELWEPVDEVFEKAAEGVTK